jgi:hypothetical protein
MVGRSMKPGAGRRNGDGKQNGKCGNSGKESMSLEHEEIRDRRPIVQSTIARQQYFDEAFS